jgi:hypothetical protein
MIAVQNTLVSDDIADKMFVCHIEKCKGACCVEGDLGAPLDEDELDIIDDILSEVMPYLSEEGKKAIEEWGPYVIDFEGDYCTTTINDRECAFSVYDEKGALKCGIEQAYLDGKISFRKPISCHLYPIRISKLKEHDALNYDKWDICSAACSLGKDLGVPLYKFLKEPLIRKYGEAWYTELEIEIKKQGKS